MPRWMLIDRYAEFVVRVGANVQPGQDVAIGALVEHAPIARAVAEQAYRAAPAGSWSTTATSTSSARRSRSRPTTRSARTTRTSSIGSAGGPTTMSPIIFLTGNPDSHVFDGLDPGRGSRRFRRRPSPRPSARSCRAIQWTVGRGAERRLGGAGLRGARRGPPVGRRGDRDPPRRAGPGGRLARAPGGPEPARVAAIDQVAARCGPFPAARART